MLLSTWSSPRLRGRLHTLSPSLTSSKERNSSAWKRFQSFHVRPHSPLFWIPLHGISSQVQDKKKKIRKAKEEAAAERKAKGLYILLILSILLYCPYWTNLEFDSFELDIMILLLQVWIPRMVETYSRRSMMRICFSSFWVLKSSPFDRVWKPLFPNWTGCVIEDWYRKLKILLWFGHLDCPLDRNFVILFIDIFGIYLSIMPMFLTLYLYWNKWNFCGEKIIDASFHN